MSREFNIWLSGFRDSIADYGYYIDFEKVHRNVGNIKVELNILNSLIGSDNIEDDFENLIKKYPEVLKCIPLLLAVRANEIYAIDGDGAFTYNFKKVNLDSEQYKVFMRKTGLFDLIANHIVNNLVDYATGVETGLDSNGRKNRGGHLMENLVESFIKKAGFVKDETYFKEMYIHQITEKWDIDLSAISNQGKMEKRFDYVVKTDNMIYGIEDKGYIYRKIKALVMTVFIVFLFLFILIFPLFGNKIVELVTYVNLNAKVTEELKKIFDFLQGPFALFIIFLFIKIIYAMAPDVRIPSKNVNYGAIFTSIGWLVVTWIYSFYINLHN